MSASVEFLERKKPKAAHTFAQDSLQWYVEPEWCTAALLRVERFVGDVLDPACGRGNIVRACLAAGYRASGTDVVDRSAGAPWFRGTLDFIAGDDLRADNIITNPPFFRARGSEAFARRALAVCRGKVAVFADMRFLASGRRAGGLFAEYRPTRIWQLADRPSCPPGAYLDAGNTAGGGSADWCWIVWDLTGPARATEFDWLRRAA